MNKYMQLSLQIGFIATACFLGAVCGKLIAIYMGWAQ